MHWYPTLRSCKKVKNRCKKRLTRWWMVASPCPAPRLTIDLLLSGSSVAVGGCLSLLLDSWKSMTRGQYVLLLLQHGLHLRFHFQLLLTTSLAPFLGQSFWVLTQIRAEKIWKVSCVTCCIDLHTAYALYDAASGVRLAFSLVWLVGDQFSCGNNIF